MDLVIGSRLIQSRSAMPDEIRTTIEELEQIENNSKIILYADDLTTANNAQYKVHGYLLESFHNIEVLIKERQAYCEERSLDLTPGQYPPANSRIPLAPGSQTFPFPNFPTANQLRDYMYEYMLDLQHEISQRQNIISTNDAARFEVPVNPCKKFLNVFRYIHRLQMLERLETFIARSKTEAVN
jgi:hypothetical protein